MKSFRTSMHHGLHTLIAAACVGRFIFHFTVHKTLNQYAGTRYYTQVFVNSFLINTAPCTASDPYHSFP